MKRAMLALAVAAGLAAGCGKMKDVNPLNSPGGASADPARFSFEDGTVMGFTEGTVDSNGVDQVFNTDGAAFAGARCLGGHITGFDHVTPFEVQTAVSADLTGKTLSAWVFVPTQASYSDNKPIYAQIFVKTDTSYANGKGVNMSPGSWTRVSFSPVANTGAADIDNGVYIKAGFDPAGATLVGVKVAMQAATPASFRYTGNLLVDSLTW